MYSGFWCWTLDRPQPLAVSANAKASFYYLNVTCKPYNFNQGQSSTCGGKRM